MPTLDDYYRALGVNAGATAEEIRAAYLDLVKVWHPDRFQHDAKLQRKANDELARINEAYNAIVSTKPNDEAARQQSPGNRDETPPFTSHNAHGTRWRDTPSSSPRQSPFITDLADGETVEIVDLRSDDSYHAQKAGIVGLPITVTRPIHRGGGWYCAHATFISPNADLPSTVDGSVLFGYVRVRRLIEG